MIIIEVVPKTKGTIQLTEDMVRFINKGGISTYRVNKKSISQISLSNWEWERDFRLRFGTDVFKIRVPINAIKNNQVILPEYMRFK